MNDVSKWWVSTNVTVTLVILTPYLSIKFLISFNKFFRIIIEFFTLNLPMSPPRHMFLSCFISCDCEYMYVYIQWLWLWAYYSLINAPLICIHKIFFICIERIKLSESRYLRYVRRSQMHMIRIAEEEYKQERSHMRLASRELPSPAAE